MSSRKNESNESISQFGSRDENLNRSSEVRASKIKVRTAHNKKFTLEFRPKLKNKNHY